MATYKGSLNQLIKVLENRVKNVPRRAIKKGRFKAHLTKEALSTLKRCILCLDKN